MEIPLCDRCTDILKQIPWEDAKREPTLTDRLPRLWPNQLCDLCDLIYSMFEESGLLPTHDWKNHLRIAVTSSNHHIQPGITVIEVSPTRRWPQTPAAKDTLSAFPKRMIVLYASPLSAAAWAGKVHIGPQITSSGSPEALELVKAHHRRCLNQHTGACRQTLSGEAVDDQQGTPLPTRILDIGQGELSDVRLVQPPRALRGQYAALSYCWGSSTKAPPKTTTKNLTDRLDGVGLAFDDLPKTFQEAVTVTRLLGLRYLWIDSLCILQDSPDDWAKEALTMCDVYAHAQVVIAASSAPDPYSGLFETYPRLPSTVLPYFDASGSPSGTIQAVMLPWMVSRINRSEDKGVLATRGWTLQEDVLAGRILYFTNRSVVWRCAEAHVDELYDFDTRGGQERWTHQSRFDEIVSKYSDRKLTYMSDKRIAMQGITAAFEKARQEKCYFGCWGEDLLEDLHWHRDTPDDSHIFLVRPVELQEQPSWSWLSTSGQVYTNRIVERQG